MTPIRKKVYLAGGISSDTETYKWRQKAEELLEPKYQVLNPAANKFNRSLIKEHKEDVEEFKKEAIKKSQRILIVKDYNLVSAADIILVNLQLLTEEKPLVGTLFELAWAWILKKPVIAVVGDNWYCQHPFPVATFAATASSLKEACDLILYFFEE